MTLDELRTRIEELERDLHEQLTAVDGSASLDAFRVAFLGRKGRVSQLF